jgi:hypothetical protein
VQCSRGVSRAGRNRRGCELPGKRNALRPNRLHPPGVAPSLVKGALKRFQGQTKSPVVGLGNWATWQAGNLAGLFFPIAKLPNRQIAECEIPDWRSAWLPCRPDPHRQAGRVCGAAKIQVKAKEMGEKQAGVLRHALRRANPSATRCFSDLPRAPWFACASARFLV